MVAEMLTDIKTADGKELFTLMTGSIHLDFDLAAINRMILVAQEYLVGNVSMIVFCPDAEEASYEDEGRTYRYPLKNIDAMELRKVYAKLDDYGSVEALRRSTGEISLSTQYVMTLLFAHEY